VARLAAVRAPGKPIWLDFAPGPKEPAPALKAKLSAFTELLQFVAFSRRANQSVSLAPARPWRTAAMHTIGTAEPGILKAVEVVGRPKFRLPPLDWYAAVEFKSSVTQQPAVNASPGGACSLAQRWEPWEGWSRREAQWRRPRRSHP
jgi:hypothetical protein